MKNNLKPLTRRLIVFLSFMLISAVNGSTFKTHDGTQLDYQLMGKGNALVMLHSGMMSRDDMQLQIDYFSKHYQVIALDSREQGRSAESKSKISYELMAKDVIALLDHLKIERASIFGQSDGGITGLITAHYYPSRLTKIIIHGAVYNYRAYSAERREGMKKYTWDANNPKDNDPKGFPGMAIESYLLGRKNLDNFESHLQEMAIMWATSPNLTKDDLNKIKVPTLVIVGDHWDISLTHSVEMHEALANSELFVAPGATHFIHQEKPDLLNRVIHEFLNQK